MHISNLINAIIALSFVAYWNWDIGTSNFWRIMLFSDRHRINKHIGTVSLSMMTWAYIGWGLINAIAAID